MNFVKGGEKKNEERKSNREREGGNNCDTLKEAKEQLMCG